MSVYDWRWILQTENGRSGFTRVTVATRMFRSVDSDHDWLGDLMVSADVPACVIEMLHDDERIDYRFICTSAAFEAATGLHDAAGRTMRELRPDHEQHWFDLYDRVAYTGAPAKFEYAARALDRRFRGCAFRIGSPEAARVVVIFEEDRS